MIAEATLAVLTLLRPQLQGLWSTLTSRYDVETVAFVGLSGSLMFGYFLGCIPYVVMDYVKAPATDKFKVQKDSYADGKILALLFLILVFPMIYGFVTKMGLLHIRTGPVLPSALEVVNSIAFFFLVEDYLNYWIHRWLHSPWMYKNVHYLHHEHNAPFALAASYAHPVEIILLGIPTFMGPIIAAPHLYTLWVWLMMRQYEAIDIHSGYELPWNLNSYLGFYAGTEHHDYHHHRYSGNFASVFTWCDRLYGTNDGYEHYLRAKRKVA